MQVHRHTGCGERERERDRERETAPATFGRINGDRLDRHFTREMSRFAWSCLHCGLNKPDGLSPSRTGVPFRTAIPCWGQTSQFPTRVVVCTQNGTAVLKGLNARGVPLLLLLCILWAVTLKKRLRQVLRHGCGLRQGIEARVRAASVLRLLFWVQRRPVLLTELPQPSVAQPFIAQPLQLR